MRRSAPWCARRSPTTVCACSWARTVHAIQRRCDPGSRCRPTPDLAADVVLVVTGVRPNVDLGLQAGVQLGAAALAVEHACRRRRFAGVLGTQVVQGLRPRRRRHRPARHPRSGARLTDPGPSRSSCPTTSATTPAPSTSTIRLTADQDTGQLLGAQIAGASAAKSPSASTPSPPRFDHRMTVDELNDLDLSYTPPFSAPMGSGAGRRPGVARRLVAADTVGTASCGDVRTQRTHARTDPTDQALLGWRGRGGSAGVRRGRRPRPASPVKAIPDQTHRGDRNTIRAHARPTPWTPANEVRAEVGATVGRR